MFRGRKCDWSFSVVCYAEITTYDGHPPVAEYQTLTTHTEFNTYTYI
jgi:hypothetical protein